MQSNTVEEGIIPNNLIIATTPTNNMRRRRFHNITSTIIDNDEYNDEPVYNTTSRQLDLTDGYNNINDDLAMIEGKKRGYNQLHKKKKERSLISILTFLMALLYTLGGHTTLIQQLQTTSVSIIPTSISRLLSLNTQQDVNINNGGDINNNEEQERPSFVYEHPYVSSSYYTSTASIETLMVTQDNQVIRNLRREAEQAAYGYDSTLGEGGEEKRKRETRLAIVRPFCEFDAEALPTTFTCWNALPPCKAATDDIGDDDYDNEREGRYEVDNYGELISYNSNSTSGRNLYDQATTSGEDRHTFDLVGSDAMKNAKADVFLFYSQTFSENDVAIKAVDTIIDQFFEPGGWSQCFDNIYAIEANIPQELDLYIPSAQEELYNWVNGPNRQFEAAFRIIQSGEWGEYDGFYLMEGDSVPIKAYWLDVVLSEIEVNRPFAILGA